jgi:predicted alpha/beta hydrolase
MTDPRTFGLTAADGYTLGALRYPAAGTPTGRLVIAGATGVPQRFYGRFAAHAARQGIDTYTLDYRGVGASRPPSLRGFRMDYLDWARQDLAALLDHACASGDGPVWMVGHSFGGHAFGLLPGHVRVQRLVTFGTGAGWHGWMPRLEQLRVQFLWHVVGPLLVHTRGYLAWRALGLGEDLPRDVYRQWKRWCRWPRYFFEDPEMPGVIEQFAAVRTPIAAVNAVDDRWAPPASRDAFMSGYRGAPVERVTVAPAQLGVRRIGHLNYVRPGSEALWDATLQWLREGGAWPMGGLAPGEREAATLRPGPAA